MKIINNGLILISIFFVFIGVLWADETDLGVCALYDLDGKKVSLSDYKGKPLVVCFWTTWCPYCRREIKKLNQLYPKLKLSGIEVLAINVDERRSKVIRFLKTYSVDYKVVLDEGGECAQYFDVIGIPTYLLINREGKVRYMRSSFPKDRYEELLLR